MSDLSPGEPGVVVDGFARQVSCLTFVKSSLHAGRKPPTAVHVAWQEGRQNEAKENRSTTLNEEYGCP